MFQTLCSDPQASSRIDKEVLQNVLAKSGLPDTTLASVSMKYLSTERVFTSCVLCSLLIFVLQETDLK